MLHAPRIRTVFLTGFSATPSTWRIRLHARRILTVLLALGALGATAVQAQTLRLPGAAGNDVLTLNVYGGGFSPAADLTADDRFRSSGTVGGALTLWVHPNVGLRGNVLYARTDMPSAAPEPLPGENPNVWAYSGDLVLRLPLAADNRRDTWFPYILGGLGGKTYDFDTLSTETDFAGNFGAGIEYRFAQWGLQAEVRDIVSRFNRLGVDRTQHDVVWTAGITVSF